MTTPPAEGTDSLPISLVAHVAFCPRRLWLEAVGEKVASVAIEQDVAEHEAVDRRRDERRDRRRSVEVRSARLGVHGRCDVVDVEADGSVEVVEFKSASLRRSTSVSAQQRLQLVLQGLALQEAGHRVSGYSVYFTTARRTVAVEVSEVDEADAVEAVVRARAIVNAAAAPPPLQGDPRCDRCSHAGVCLPEERSTVAVARRVHAADPDGEVLHLTTPGARAFLSRGRVEVVRGEERIGSLPVDRVQGLVIHGNVDVSSALLRELLWRRVSVVWASGGGRVVGFARSADAPNGRPRVLQHVASHEGRLDLARELVGAKIANQATFLRRAARLDVGAQVGALRGFSREARSVGTVGELLGLEGAASATYFSRWSSLFSERVDSRFVQGWRGRVGRGAEDRLNVALNMTYSLLLGEVVRAVLACGLDPHAGFVHSSSRNKPALALDLMEQFRPVVADSVVVGVINNDELRADMFTDVLGGARLTDAGRKVLVRGYERRVEQEFRHPVFGYLVSWRRAMEVQARMLLGVLDGTQDRYVGIRVR